MLQTYKDEVDTLNEALKIAAMDIAEVAEAEDDYFLSDDDDEEEEEEDASRDVSRGDDALSVSAASESVSYASTHTQERAGSGLGRTSKEILYREALKDSSTAGSKTAAAAMGQQKTFVVNEDGTFEKK